MTDQYEPKTSAPGIFIHALAAFHEWFARRPQQRRLLDPLRKATAGQASGVVLEVGAGTDRTSPGMTRRE